MTELKVRRLAAGLLAATGALHLVLAPEYLDETAYIGGLFIFGGMTALLAAARLWQTSDRLAWSGGTLIAVGMVVGFVGSRTVGLPGFHEVDWELSGIVSVLIELGFLGACGLHARNQGRELQTT